MCLTCGCMEAHREMGEHNIRYEDVEAAARENGQSVAETFAIMARTEAKDRQSHPSEYAEEFRLAPDRGHSSRRHGASGPVGRNLPPTA